MEIVQTLSGEKLVYIKLNAYKRQKQVQNLIDYWNEQQGTSMQMHACRPFGGFITAFGYQASNQKRLDPTYLEFINIRETSLKNNDNRYKICSVLNRNTKGSKQNDTSHPDMSYDIVKKRRTIDEANTAVGADVTEALLGEEGAKYFFEFSDAVKEAFETLTIAETKVNEDEVRTVNLNTTKHVHILKQRAL